MATAAADFQCLDPHAREYSSVISELNSSPDGLTADEAARRLAGNGPNRLPSPPGPGLLRRFFKHFNDPLIYVLLGAAIITSLLRHWVDTGVILGVVTINAIIGFIQEGKAEKALEGIRKMLSLQAQVLRDTAWVTIDAADIVPGDIVRLRSGDRVPADMRLLEVHNLSAEESALTGESVPVEKNTTAVAHDAMPGDQTCMAFSGTLITTGRAVGVVTHTGSSTRIGRISTMLAEVKTISTPLMRQMARFGTVLSISIVALAIIMFLVGYFIHGLGLADLFLASIGFAVAAIPEGLPAVLSITLALGVQRMARHSAITRRLNAVETLGSVTVICSDKTGTLTRNEMTSRHVITRLKRYDIDGTGYAPQGAILHDGHTVSAAENADLFELVEVMAVCNDSRVVEEDGHWKVVGEPTEGALRTLALKGAFDAEEYQRVAVIPFESDNKFMAALVKAHGGQRRILLKGAPDRLLDRCAHQKAPDGSLETLDRAFWEKAIDELSSTGLRVLAAASREAGSHPDSLNIDDLNHDMIFLGLVGIIDPPRPEAIQAISICRQAGIRVKMITGDHSGTALAIGREMGIGSDAGAISGHDLENASDKELRHIVHQYDIFARTSPEHKLRLVTALQAAGEVVAMTGDGINDAPALKRADVGVAMGIKGTEATKEAADIVLADDNFATIERAVEEGRTIYDNLRKAILFILPTNGAEAFVVLAAVVFGFILPILPVQILWVNMVTAVTLALALAFEPSEPGLMLRPPRKAGAPILGAYFLWRISFVSLLIGGITIAIFLFETNRGMADELARTLAVNTLVVAQMFYLFNSRFMRESSLRLDSLFANRAVWITIGCLSAVQLLYVYAPFMNLLFSSRPMAAAHWVVPLAAGACVFVIVEIEKALMRALNPLPAQPVHDSVHNKS
jgi:magnesium-transporting ATPase (P-type)